MVNPDAPPAREQHELAPSAASRLELTLAWTFVGIPLLYGVYQVVAKALLLFREAR
jgi:hypothetical protein